MSKLDSSLSKKEKETLGWERRRGRGISRSCKLEKPPLSDDDPGAPKTFSSLHSEKYRASRQHSIRSSFRWRKKTEKARVLAWCLDDWIRRILHRVASSSSPSW